MTNRIVLILLLPNFANLECTRRTILLNNHSPLSWNLSMENEVKKEYSILLYYCYTKIEDPQLYRDEHHQKCLDLNLRGRILVAKEGLNGTVSGLKEDCEAYMEYVHNDPRFSHTEFKIEAHDKHSFQKLHVRVKDEIVHSSLSHIDPNERTGKHLEPNEFKAMKDNEDVVILDVRSNYEHNLGKFKNAVTLDIENFRDFPERVKEIKDQLEGKKILTYCTGGIKCEKASAYLLEQGFEDVFQLHGGIIKYGMEAGGEDFEGKCYVFDGRVATDVNSVNPTILSECHVCGGKSDHMVNCANVVCNLHTVICESCMEKMEGCCSEDCKESETKREWNMEGYYPTKMNGYDPNKHSKRATCDH